MTIHANALRWQEKGVLIRGPSGSGKSDLSLRLLDRGWQLVSDDYCFITSEAGHLFAQVPDNIAGKIEVRGLGIVPVSHVQKTGVHAVIDLVQNPVERLPEPMFDYIDGFENGDGHKMPLLQIQAFEASTPIKIELFLTSLTENPA